MIKSLISVLVLSVMLTGAAWAGDGPVTDIKVGGQIRLRGELRDQGDDTTTTDALMGRFRLNASGMVGPRVGFFLSVQDSRNFGEGGAANAINDLDGVDLREGYMDVKEIAEILGLKTELRLGRWAMSYGDQRLVSPLDWNPVGRSWDGGRLRLANENYSLDLFTTQIAETGEAFDEAYTFSGFYDTWKYNEKNSAEFYGFWKRQNPKVNQYTLGLHAKGKIGDSVGYNLEGAYQLGNGSVKKGPSPTDPNVIVTTINGSIDTSAYGLVVGLDAMLAEIHQIAVELTYASGDDDPNDKEINTFDPLFPFGHAYQGHMDVFAWKNGLDAMLRYNVKTGAATWFVDIHNFMLASDKDAWYGAGGAPYKTGGDETQIGQEIDLYVKAKVAESVAIWTGYSHFFAGDYVKDMKDIDWAFLQTTLDF